MGTPGKPLTPTQRERIKRDIADGFNTSQTARRNKVSQSTVCSVVGSVKEINKPKQIARHKLIHRMAADGLNGLEIARRLGVKQHVVYECLKTKVPEEPAIDLLPNGELPKSHKKERPAFGVDRKGHWLVLCDVHLPYHDETTVKLAVSQARADNAVGVILNGDFIDSHEVSSHDKDPSALRYQAEIECGKQFLGWLRGQLPKADIIFKHGNHEERLDRYVFSRAPALFDLEGVNLRSLLHFKDFGIDEVKDNRVIKLGMLNLLHGHEYKGSGGQNPAKWLLDRAKSVVMAGHFHRSHEYADPTIDGRLDTAWSVGCACELNPLYLPYSKWNNGYAMVEVGQQGDFHVRNIRIINGKAY